MQDPLITNPTAVIDLDFGHYLEVRERELSSHLVGGIPDYAFSLDQKLRQQLTAIRPVRSITQAIVGLAVPLQKQIHQMESIAVGPQQYPEIHALGEDCARRLGIGIPQIFIYPTSISNAYTIATDDVEPVIVLSSEIVETLEPEELKFVIGHECGHVHNLHGVYNTALEIMTNPLAQLILQALPTQGVLEPIIQGSLNLFFKRWSRCAEITCDRAGLICCSDVITAQVALAKLVTGGGNSLKNINIQAYIEQLPKMKSNPGRFLELFSTHPLIPKRIKAISLFANCEVFHSWRSQLPSPTPAYSKSETDDLCEQVIRVLA